MCFWRGNNYKDLPFFLLCRYCKHLLMDEKLVEIELNYSYQTDISA